MLIFSEITCRADTTDFVARGLVSGQPVCYADLIDWTVFRSFLKECTRTSKVMVDVKTYGYGEEEAWDATPEEVAYMQMRQERDERFFETRCIKVGTHKVSIDLSRFGKDINLSQVIRT